MLSLLVMSTLAASAEIKEYEERQSLKMEAEKAQGAL